MNARHTTLTDLFALFEGLQSQQRRLPVRPQDAHDDYYPSFEREAAAADRAYQFRKEQGE